MKKKKQHINEGIFSAADKFIAAFFDGLEKKSADRVIKAAENAKLPPHAVKLIKDIEDSSERLKKMIKEL